jgi:hypothetical protein
MDKNDPAPRIKALDHGDLRALLEQAPRQTSGTTVRSRRRAERAPLKSTDRRRKSERARRDKQFNTNVTTDLFETVADVCERHDLTKAEFTERAFLAYIEKLRGGNRDGVTSA